MNSLFGNLNQNGMAMPNLMPTQAGNRINAAQVISLIKNSGKTPEQIVRGMIDQGMISQQDFENYRTIANRTFGTNL